MAKPNKARAEKCFVTLCVVIRKYDDDDDDDDQSNNGKNEKGKGLQKVFLCCLMTI